MERQYNGVCIDGPMEGEKICHYSNRFETYPIPQLKKVESITDTPSTVKGIVVYNWFFLDSGKKPGFWSVEPPNQNYR
jgi:hypothetical protein